MPYYQASVWEISVGLDQLIPLLSIHKTSVWFLEKQSCIKQRSLGSVVLLLGWVTYLTSPLLLVSTADTKRQNRLNAKLKATATYSVRGVKGKLTIAELKIHDCTRSSHMTTLIEEIIWSTGGFYG